jgi:SPP1 gp7 family putative phage head morphogenesis protein
MLHPVLPESIIIGDRDRIEQRWAKEFPTVLKSALQKVPIYQISAKISLSSQRELKALWIKGWKLGINHGDRELKIVGSKRKARFAWASFGEEDRITNVRAENAIDTRISQLAITLGNTEWVRIQKYLSESIKGDISRANLTQAIAEVLGGDRFKSRAETIARTELATAYNSGRIQTFRDNKIQAVRLYCILDERTCPVCLALNNQTARLDDWIAMQRINAPKHPRCRCTISPVIDDTLVSSIRSLPPIEEDGNIYDRTEILSSVLR